MPYRRYGLGWGGGAHGPEANHTIHHPIPSHPIPSHPILPHPTPLHPIPSYPIPSNPILYRYGSGWVVTQAALNGVARYAGHALQIMALVRPAAPSAFEGLRQLVDLYMYCAFTLFCPQWAIDGKRWVRGGLWRRGVRVGFTLSGWHADIAVKV